MHDQSTAPEEWRAVVGYEGRYEVSNRGRVRSLVLYRRDPILGRIFTATPDSKGYAQVMLRRDRTPRMWLVHHLVAYAFIGPKPFPKAVMRHLDGDKTNNTPGNLRWGTQKENIQDTVRHGHTQRGERHRSAKLTDAMVRAIREAYAQGRYNHPQLARLYGVDQSQISRIIARSGRGGWAHVE